MGYGMAFYSTEQARGEVEIVHLDETRASDVVCSLQYLHNAVKAKF